MALSSDKIAFTLTPKDKGVIDAFGAKKALVGKLLETDGRSLWKLGMGSEKVAVWRGSKVAITSTESVKSDETILRYLAKRVGKKNIMFTDDRPGFEKSLKFHTDGDSMSGQWDGVIYAVLPFEADEPFRSEEFADTSEWPMNLAGILRWTRYQGEYSINSVEVRPEFRRSGVASELYKKLFRDEGITKKNLQPGYQTEQGAAFRENARISSLDLIPPKAVADAAAKGLKYRQKATPSNRGGLTPSEASKEGIGSGVQRAVNLKNRDKISPETISKMVGFFSRHEKNKSVAPEHRNEPWNDKGHVSWLLWGGDPGKQWAEKVQKQLSEKVASRYLAAKERKPWEEVGLFFPLPKHLAKQFPSLGENDTSPSHITFLYVGEIAPEEGDRFLEVLQNIHGKWWPEVTATLGKLAHFEHPDKDRRVAHVQVEFDKDLSGMKHRVRQELTDAGFVVQDSFPEYRPHVTLAYMDGADHPDYDGPIPEGSWDIHGVEVWGMPEKHMISFRPSSKVLARAWLAKQGMTFRVASQWLRSKEAWELEGSNHARSIALMKWLSQATQKLGVGRDTYVVGGAIRNFVIKQPIKDIDIVIDSVAAGHDSDWLAAQLSRMIPVPSNFTTNQYGVAILTVKGDWDLDGENMKGEVIEIANARKESYGGEGGKGYKPSDVVPATIHEDLVRREFTFNTLLWRLSDLASGPEKAEILDLTGCGMRDLQDGILACPSDPDKTFSDDPTRILRAIKFTGKYGFKIPPDLAQAIKRNAPKMKRMPWEAIGTILVDNILKEPTARKSLQQMKDLGILDVVSDMVRTTKPFASYLVGQLKSNRRVGLLLDLMDLGVPAGTPLTGLNLNPQQIARFRQLTLEMGEDVASGFLDSLLSPPVDNMRVIETLGLKGSDRAKIKPVAQAILLASPELASNTKQLTERVLQELR